MLPVVCMFLAGLYVGLGSFGIAAASLVSKGNLLGKGGPVEPFGIPRGPNGLEDECDAVWAGESKEDLPFVCSALTAATGELCKEDESGTLVCGGLVSSVLSCANRALRSCGGGPGIFCAVAVTLEMARPWSDSGFGEGVGFTFCTVVLPG